MLTARTESGFKMEIGRDQHYQHFLCWISNAQHYVIGFGKQRTMLDAVRQAMIEAKGRGAPNRELSTLLDQWLFL